MEHLKTCHLKRRQKKCVILPHCQPPTFYDNPLQLSLMIVIPCFENCSSVSEYYFIQKHSRACLEWEGLTWERMWVDRGWEGKWGGHLTVKVSHLHRLVINGDKRSEQVTDWLVVAHCNCVCFRALPGIINYRRKAVCIKRVKENIAGFITWEWQREKAFSCSVSDP